MQAKLKRSAAVLGTLLCTVAPAITHAETQQEWFQKQLQLTDGYIPEASTPVLRKSDGNTSRTDTKAAKSADGGTGYVGASKEGGVGRLIGSPKNYFNGFSPYASDFKYSAP